jgi:outer membrane protein OmpA-like peptidoglycan-associated protein
MRILIIGFVAFAAWAWLSTYIYVCKIKGLCNEPYTSLVEAVNPINALAASPVAAQQQVVPKDFVVYFAFDKSDYVSGSDAIEYLDKVNAYIKLNSNAFVSITGHTDAVGTNDYNQALGYRRAQTMQKYFEARGLVASKIKLESKGENEPADDNATTSGRSNNRRTVVTLK